MKYASLIDEAIEKLIRDACAHAFAAGWSRCHEYHGGPWTAMELNIRQIKIEEYEAERKYGEDQ